MKIPHKNSKNSAYWEHEFIQSFMASNDIVADKEGFYDRGVFYRLTQHGLSFLIAHYKQPNVIGVFLHLASLLDRDRLELNVTHEQIKKALGYSNVESVRLAMKVLEGNLVVSKIRSGLYIINPRIVYKGNRAKLYKEYDLINKIMERDEQHEFKASFGRGIKGFGFSQEDGEKP